MSILKNAKSVNEMTSTYEINVVQNDRWLWVPAEEVAIGTCITVLKQTYEQSVNGFVSHWIIQKT